jgi:catechol 2,3-dioxygenase-like lactoylglutathione lyase family enzyme
LETEYCSVCDFDVEEVIVGFHHVSLATKDMAATHRFYTEVMGFELVKVQAGPTPGGNGWARLAFFDTGGQGLMSFFDLHDDSIGSQYSTDLSGSVGLPTWVNHVAFDAPSVDALEAHKQQWMRHGITVMQMDWGSTLSIYATDPNGVLVEFTCTTQPSFATQADRTSALDRLTAERPEFDPPPVPQFFEPVEAGAS